MNIDDVPKDDKQFGKFMDAIPMTPIPHDGDPPEGLYATHQGVLEIAGFKLKAYRLNDGQRVFDCDDVEAFFDGMGVDLS